MSGVSARNQAANLHDRLTIELKCCEESHKGVAEQSLSSTLTLPLRCRATCTRGRARAAADARLQKQCLHFNLRSSCTADLRKDRRNPGFFRHSLPPQQRLLLSLLSCREDAEARKRNHPLLLHVQSQPSPCDQARALTSF